MAQDQPANPAHQTPIVSDFWSDETMVGIITIFLNEIPGRIAALEKNFNSGNREELCRMIHQLKGAGGGYGFPIITTTALAVEKLIRSSEEQWQSRAAGPFADFMGILRRVHAGRAISRHT